MIPMAIPSVGGMLFVLLALFSVPVLYCLMEEQKLKARHRLDRAGSKAGG
jgi:Cu(I)/Ag(I) efflux system membrane protein CusA/SilA